MAHSKPENAMLDLCAKVAVLCFLKAATKEIRHCPLKKSPTLHTVPFIDSPEGFNCNSLPLEGTRPPPKPLFTLCSPLDLSAPCSCALSLQEWSMHSPTQRCWGRGSHSTAAPHRMPGTLSPTKNTHPTSPLRPGPEECCHF